MTKRCKENLKCPLIAEMHSSEIFGLIFFLKKSRTKSNKIKIYKIINSKDKMNIDLFSKC